MAKIVHNDVLDAALAKIATCTRQDICSQQPTNLTEATTTYSRGNYTMTAGTGNGDYLISDGDTNGRKVRMLAQTGNNATSTGNVDHVALTDGSALLYVTTCPTKAVTNGEPFDISAWDVEIADPT